jgi:hypothetical protein
MGGMTSTQTISSTTDSLTDDRMAYCIVNEEKRYAYVNIAKAACTSIKLAIADDLGVSFDHVQWHRPWKQSLGWACERTNSLDMFTFARHPADRLVSCWADWCCEPVPDNGNFARNPSMRRFIGMEFREFAETSCRMDTPQMNEHFAPQADAISLCGTVVPSVSLYHFETIRDDWATLQDKHGLPDLPHDRKSIHRPWREYYDSDLLAMVEQRYATDYELGGYAKECC